MNSGALRMTASQIVEKAKEYGASLAGIAGVDDVRNSPSHILYEKLDAYKGIGTIQTKSAKQREIEWPENAESAVVIAVEHPDDRPELDWWKDGFAGGTEGNRILISIAARLSSWLKEDKGIGTTKLPYHIENGGIFLKDAALMAGLGCIGKNNMLVTPEYGPRVRLRALLTDKALLSTGPRDFDPCRECNVPCRKACPQRAFGERIYSKERLGLTQLPGRTGVYDRVRCNIQMQRDKDRAKEAVFDGGDVRGKVVKYCRLCEWSCPVSRS
jgi:epoxyqueuosine reductase